MSKVKRKKWSCSKNCTELTSKISFINNNVLKSIMTIKNLWINWRTELTIALSRIFLVTSPFTKTKMCKTENKERLEKTNESNLKSNYKKISKSSSNFFFNLFKKIEKLKFNTHSAFLCCKHNSLTQTHVYSCLYCL